MILPRHPIGLHEIPGTSHLRVCNMGVLAECFGVSAELFLSRCGKLLDLDDIRAGIVQPG